jgi:oxysterol-binding protein 1
LEALRSGRQRLLHRRVHPFCKTLISKLFIKTLVGDTAILQPLLASYQTAQPTTPTSFSSSSSQAIANPQPSPLTLAVQCAQTPTVEYILANASYIDVNHKDQYGNTALHYAARTGRADVVELLLKKRNINDTVQNHEGKQPVDISKTPEIAQILQGSFESA